MAKMKAKWLLYDTNSLKDDGSDNLQIYLVTGSALEIVAETTPGAGDGGVRIKTAGVTDAMLAGNIAFSKLADNANIARLDQSETIVGAWNYTGTAPTISGDEIATKVYVDSAITGLDFQDDVIDKQTDGTLDPTASPTTGDRYIVVDPSNANTNFKGAYADVATWVSTESITDNAIVEWDGTNFILAYTATEGGITWNQTADYFERFNGTSWDEFGGLSGVTAGAGLTKSGNTMNVGTGNGIQVNTDDIAVKPDTTGGANLAKVIDSNANGVAVKIDDNTIGENGSNQLYVKADSIGANEIDETDTYDFTGGSVDVATQTAGDDSTKAASTAFVQQEIDGTSTEVAVVQTHLITSGEDTAGWFALDYLPVSASIVTLNVHKGILQYNKQNLGGTGATADFDVLNGNQLHFNNNGIATLLSEDLSTGDIVQVIYHYDATNPTSSSSSSSSSSSA